MLNIRSNKNRSMALIVVIVLLGFMVVMASLFASHLHRTRMHHLYSLRAAYALNYAEAGISKALWELSKPDSNYKGESETSFGNGSFTVELEGMKGKDSLKLIKSTGKAFSMNIPAKYKKRFTKTVEVTIQFTSNTVSKSGRRKIKILNWQETE